MIISVMLVLVLSILKLYNTLGQKKERKGQ